MTVDASRSWLGLVACVGVVIRQIVDGRVLLTATVPPALPGGRLLGGSLAPPLDGATFSPVSLASLSHGERWPHETRQFAGDRSGDDSGRLAGPGS